MPKDTQTRWSSFENRKAEKGEGGKENQGAKGHPFNRINAGESIDLLDVKGSGTVRRIWLTFSDRSPEMLRSLKIEMYWDNAEKPAVSVPIGDFFGVGIGMRKPFESTFFSDPEGRSFNCIIPMPFKTAAKITVTNESDNDLNALFYDVDLVETPHSEELLYFHAFWNRNRKPKLKTDFQLIPKISGKGRYLGANIGILTDPLYEDTWFGEGEVKVYLDGDTQNPTLVGSGTEDYIGTAYGQQTYSNMYQGSLVADPKKGEYAFYRYHVPDPVYFYKDIKVSIQQIGGAPRDTVRKLAKNGAKLTPITVDQPPKFIKLLEQENPPQLNDEDFPDGWTNFYRSDDISATAYFYLNKPSSDLPALQSVEKRTEGLPAKK
ncbi:MAG TPA: DUF2961 domain-containing protein [Leeuwenhoekiella sp.]|nr:DUF2961 domain-containing protein [Leeuwenhoekiella sp.]